MQWEIRLGHLIRIYYKRQATANQDVNVSVYQRILANGRENIEIGEFEEDTLEMTIVHAMIVEARHIL